MLEENNLTWDDFIKVDVRIGTIINAEVFEKARHPAYILHVDFGEEIGVRKTSAQITKLYNTEELIGKQVVAVINFPCQTDSKYHERMSRDGWCGQGWRSNSAIDRQTCRKWDESWVKQT